MAQLTITVPDGLVPRVVAAVRAQMPEAASMTDAAAVRLFLAAYVRSSVALNEERAAKETARANVASARAQAWADMEVIV